MCLNLKDVYVIWQNIVSWVRELDYSFILIKEGASFHCKQKRGQPEMTKKSIANDLSIEA